MNSQYKTRKDLIKELQKLQQEHDSLKTSFEKDFIECKQATEAFIVSEIRYRRLFESAKDGILILNAETGMIVDVNPFLIELLGYSHEEYIEKAIWEIGFFKDIAANKDKFIELKQKGYVRYEDLPLKTADGRQINVEFISNVYLEDHQMVIQCNIRDITKYRHVEEEIRNMAKFPSENPCPVLRISRDGTLLYINNASMTLLPQWHLQVGKHAPTLLREAVLESIDIGKSQVLDLNYGENLYSFNIIPIVTEGYTNLYAYDITESKQLEKTLRFFNLLLGISNHSQEMIPMLKEFVAEIKNFTGCIAVGLRLLDKEGNIPYEAYAGFSRKFYESESPLSIKSDQCMCINVIKGLTDPGKSFYTKGGSFFMNGTTNFLATVSEEEKGSTRNVCSQVGYESVALIPIRTEDRIIGLIHVADPRENMVAQKVVEVLESAAVQLGAAIERVLLEEAVRQSEKDLKKKIEAATQELNKLNKTLKTELIKRKASQKELKKSIQDYKHLYTYLENVRDEEKASIARIIHDDLAQLLTTLKIELTSTKEKTDNLDFMVHDSIDSMLLLVGQCMTAVNSVISELRPHIQDKVGLIPSLKLLFSDFQKRSGITCDIRIQDDFCPVKGEAANNIYRVIQELLTNIRNHSKASYITVKISGNQSAFSVAIRDNGIGITLENISDPHSYGIIGIRERIEGNNGKITFKGTSGKGTTVHLRVPVRS